MKNLPITNKDLWTKLDNDNIHFKLHLRKECFWLSLDKKETIHFSCVNDVSPITTLEGIMITWNSNCFNLTLDDNYMIFRDE